MIFRKRWWRIRVAWLTALSVLLASFAPAVSALHGTSSGASRWMIICTSSGIIQVPLSDDGKPHDVPQNKHCPWCQFTHLPFLPLAAQQWSALRPSIGDVLCADAVVAAYKKPCWLLPPSQAPPFLI